MKTHIIIISALFALPIAAQELEIPIKKVLENASVSKDVKSNPLLVKFTESHASDTIGIEFSAIQGDEGHKWSRSTNVILNGNDGQEGNDDFTSHQVMRIQPFGPEAEDEWEDYLYVARIKSGSNSACMIIHFRCKFAFPKSMDGTVPKLEQLEVVGEKSIIK